MSNFSFSNVPVIRHSRSRQDLSHGHKTSANVGTLYPFEVQEVYFGDTFKVKTSCVSRLTSQFFRPVVDNLFLDVYYFFVPSRILYDKYVNIFGENTESAWANQQEYEVPTISGTVAQGSIADHLGLPLGPINGVSVLPFRAFAKIYDDWFRDQNNIDPMHLQKGELAASEALSNAVWSPSQYCGMPPHVAKFHDYFTSCLPAPQKGEATSISIGTTAPVTVNSDPNERSLAAVFPRQNGIIPEGTSPDPLQFRNAVSNTLTSAGPVGINGNSQLGVSLGGGPSGAAIYPSNLIGVIPELTGSADLSEVTGVTVNDLRFAFQYQKMLERDARSGTRYVEYGLSHFGVSAGDARLQRSEFLGGRRSPLSIHQVTQTTGANSDSSPLGEVGAFSLSNSQSRFTKGFTENGYVIGVFCIRQFHTYQQGVERFWFRKKRTDFYDPVFSNIGEQPVYRKELFFANDSSIDDEPFGYNEAWADLRTRPNRITGQLRSGATDSLDIWHFADEYSSSPTLSKGFIEETPDYVDRTITVNHTQQDQFLLDFWIQNIAYRAMPTYSVPSLIDHN
ncbi:major capsid protein [Microvirus mar13]|uniref:Major capsid protein n=1 Tax=Microvirus mar13 TaxID=2851145 RepID=A0A8F5RBY7_9VIRU|nr:major capsid protein [Microvirus mar13]